MQQRQLERRSCGETDLALWVRLPGQVGPDLHHPMAHGVLAPHTTEIVCIGRANLGSPSLPCCSPACAGARTRPPPPPSSNTSSIHSIHRSFDDIFGAGPTLQHALVPVLVGFRRTRQPSPVRPYTGLTWYRTYQIDTDSQTVARHRPKAGDHTQQLFCMTRPTLLGNCLAF